MKPNQTTDYFIPGTDYVFVYGTLRPELAPAEVPAVMRQLRNVGKGTIRGFLYDLGEYPGLRLDASGNEISGEVFEFNNTAVLQSLDAYEGYDPTRPSQSLFVRKQEQIRLKDKGGDLICWVYEYNRQPPSSQRIDAWIPGKKTPGKKL